MKLLFYQLLLSLIAISSLITNAQPEWVYKTPDGYVNDYFVGKGTSKISKAESIQFALEDAISIIIKNGQINIKGTENFNEFTTEVMKDGKSVSFDVVSKIAKEIYIDGSSRTISNLKEVERYTEQNGLYIDAYVLVSVPKNNPESPPNSFSPVWRSILLPGWGQLYKDQSFKGFSFMALSIGGVAGGLIFTELRKDATNKANSSRTQITRDFYNTEAKNYNTYATISYITAGAFYAWSLMDAIIDKPENLYVYIERSQNDFALSIQLSF